MCTIIFFLKTTLINAIVPNSQYIGQAVFFASVRCNCDVQCVHVQCWSTAVRHTGVLSNSWHFLLVDHNEDFFFLKWVPGYPHLSWVATFLRSCFVGVHWDTQVLPWRKVDLTFCICYPSLSTAKSCGENWQKFLVWKQKVVQRQSGFCVRVRAECDQRGSEYYDWFSMQIVVL